MNKSRPLAVISSQVLYLSSSPELNASNVTTTRSGRSPPISPVPFVVYVSQWPGLGPLFIVFGYLVGLLRSVICYMDRTLAPSLTVMYLPEEWVCLALGRGLRLSAPGSL